MTTDVAWQQITDMELISLMQTLPKMHTMGPTDEAKDYSGKLMELVQDEIQRRGEERLNR